MGSIAANDREFRWLHFVLVCQGAQYLFPIVRIDVELFPNGSHFSQHFFWIFIAVHVCIGVVGTDQIPIWERLGNPHNRIFEQVAEFRFGLLQGFFSPFTFRDILDVGHQVERPAGLFVSKLRDSAPAHYDEPPQPAWGWLRQAWPALPVFKKPKPAAGG